MPIKSIVFRFACFLLASNLAAQTIVVEPDNFAENAVLNDAVPQVSLITAGADNLPHPPAPFDVTAVSSTFPFQPPTGSKVFAHAGVPFWNSERRLRMDFDGLTSSIAIDFQGGNALVSERGRMEVYGLDGSLLDSYLTQPIIGGQIETISITRATSDIGWAVAYTIPGDSVFGRLDNLRFASPVPVPEPTTFGLAAAGLAMVLVWRRRGPIA